MKSETNHGRVFVRYFPVKALMLALRPRITASLLRPWSGLPVVVLSGETCRCKLSPGEQSDHKQAVSLLAEDGPVAVIADKGSTATVLRNPLLNWGQKFSFLPGPMPKSLVSLIKTSKRTKTKLNVSLTESSAIDVLLPDTTKPLLLSSPSSTWLLLSLFYSNCQHGLVLLQIIISIKPDCKSGALWDEITNLAQPPLKINLEKQ
jgi:hypothetical protein